MFRYRFIFRLGVLLGVLSLAGCYGGGAANKDCEPLQDIPYEGRAPKYHVKELDYEYCPYSGCLEIRTNEEDYDRLARIVEAETSSAFDSVAVVDFLGGRFATGIYLNNDDLAPIVLRESVYEGTEKPLDLTKCHAYDATSGNIYVFNDYVSVRGTAAQ